MSKNKVIIKRRLSYNNIIVITQRDTYNHEIGTEPLVHEYRSHLGGKILITYKFYIF